MQVSLQWITPQAESRNTKLINYLVSHKHWSPFEMANMCIEIVTSRAISAQILRHRSFAFQEFSQRYAEVQSHELVEARRQDTTNRQNSIDDMEQPEKDWFTYTQEILWHNALIAYNDAIGRGIAKEVARMVLPMSSQTKLYMNGTIRSWIHYLQVRTDEGVQLEHKLVADECRKIFVQEMPIIAEALEWTHG